LKAGNLPIEEYKSGSYASITRKGIDVNASIEGSFATSLNDLATFNAGLGNLRICIETRLEEAGATMAGTSINHPAWPADDAPPEYLRFTVVPVGCPPIDVVFSRKQIASSYKGVTCDDVSDKINYIVAEYRRCMENAHLARSDAGTGEPTPAA
jgi:hypothetical protein